jgi:hypothetical protein
LGRVTGGDLCTAPQLGFFASSYLASKLFFRLKMRETAQIFSKVRVILPLKVLYQKSYCDVCFGIEHASSMLWFYCQISYCDIVVGIS